MQRPSPGNIRDVNHRARTSFRRDTLQATCVAGSRPESCPVLVPVCRVLRRSVVFLGCKVVAICSWLAADAFHFLK
jgi:hypothetical protein